MKRALLIIAAVLFILGISKLSFAMMCGEHGGHKTIAQTETGTQTQTEKATEAVPKEAVNVGNKICPVSGEKIVEKMKAAYEYEGKIYNFCCPMCIDEFKKDPQKYIKKVGEELKTESKEREMQQKTQAEHETESVGDKDVYRGHHRHH